jgi:hypothetical protein
MFYNDDQIQRANATDLAVYFKSHGYECEKKGKDIHVKGFGGLYINTDENTYYCFSQSKGGNAVNCLRNIFNMTFPEAVKELLGESPVYGADSAKTPKADGNASKNKRDLEMPEQADNYKRAFAYLAQTRNIAPEIIRALINEKVLYQDKRGNAVFVHLDKDGEACGAEIVGTSTEKRYKGVATGTGESAFRFFKGDKDGIPDTAYIFESAIDMMSYVQLHPEVNNAEFVSMAGLRDFAVWQLAKRGIRIVSCVDNDEAGRKFNERLMTQSVGMQSNLYKCGFEFEMLNQSSEQQGGNVTFAKAKVNDNDCFFFQNHKDCSAVSGAMDLQGKSFVAVHAEDYFAINSDCAKENVKDFNELLSKTRFSKEKPNKPKQTMKDIMAAVTGKRQGQQNAPNEKGGTEPRKEAKTP